MDGPATVYSALQECSKSLSGTFTQRDILLWIRDHYPNVRESTLRAHVQALTSNATNREQNHPGLGSRPPLFDRVSHGVYRVHEEQSANEQSSVVHDTWRRRDDSSGPQGKAARARDPHMARASADILLVSCVKSKRSAAAAAKDLYTSALFTKERSYAERSGLPWYILSAKYGLVGPEEWIEPYETYLPEMDASYQRAWGRLVVEQLRHSVGPLDGRVIEIHAGSTYLEAIRSRLTELGAIVLEPLDGLRMGERLAWYGHEQDAQLPAAPTSHVDASEIRQMVDRLADDTAALSPTAFLETRGVGLKVPGLYSWWVDEDGASTLSRGLELHLPPGLIYAGLAGATHWPSGKRSTNTLWLRIQSMHLGRKARFSTFRLTLGSILAAGEDAGRIEEAGLSAWMHQHLRVVTAPYLDADALGVVESEVLLALDPPLNLRGMQDSALRKRLTQLRKAVSA